MFERSGFEDDGIFDWDILKKQKEQAGGAGGGGPFIKLGEYIHTLTLLLFKSDKLFVDIIVSTTLVFIFCLIIVL